MKQWIFQKLNISFGFLVDFSKTEHFFYGIFVAGCPKTKRDLKKFIPVLAENIVPQTTRPVCSLSYFFLNLIKLLPSFASLAFFVSNIFQVPKAKKNNWIRKINKKIDITWSFWALSASIVSSLNCGSLVGSSWISNLIAFNWEIFVRKKKTKKISRNFLRKSFAISLFPHFKRRF